MADFQDSEDRKLKEELESYGETVTKINDKTRPIYVKKLNHLKARQMMAEKASESQRKKSPSRRVTALPHELPFLKTESDEEDASNGTEERKIRRRTVHGGPIITPMTRSKTPPRSPGRRSAAFPSSVSNYEKGNGSVITANKTPPRVSNISAPDGAYASSRTPPRTTGHLYNGTGRTPPRTASFLPDRSLINASQISQRQSVFSNVNKSMMDFSDSEGEAKPDMTSKGVNTSFLLDDTLETTRSPYSMDRNRKLSPVKNFGIRNVDNNTQQKRIGQRTFTIYRNLRMDLLWSRAVIICVLFFLAVALAYSYKVFFQSSPAGLISEGKVCLNVSRKETMDKICLEAEDKTALTNLFWILARRAGEVDCGYQKPAVAREMTVVEAFKILSQDYGFKEVVRPDNGGQSNKDTILELMSQNSVNWNIRLFDKEKVELTSEQSFKNIFHMESINGDRSAFCRLKRAIQRVTFNIVMIVVGLISLALLILLIAYIRRKNEQEKREVHQMAQEIISLLQNNASACRTDQSLKPYLSISHVRDSLIPLPDRKKKKRVWNKAVKLIASSESRVREEVQRVAGEESAVWRWMDPSSDLKTKDYGSSSVTPSRESKTQSSLMIDSKMVYSCLKVFNVTDLTEGFVEDETRDAILDKCGQYHGILHIGCDPIMEPGCVFVKCVSESAASQNYKALHGWSHKGRLISVKFVSPIIYRMMFDDSENAMVPLRSSQYKRRSFYGTAPDIN